MKIRTETIEEIKWMKEQGFSNHEIAEKVGCCSTTISLYLNGRQHRKQNMPVMVPAKKWNLPEEVDFYRLPDEVLFSYKLFPAF